MAPVIERLAEARAAIAAADLYLAYGCACGDRTALAAYDELVAPILARLAQRWRHTRIDASELAQALRVRLFVGGGDGLPRIAQYRGEGSLAQWLRIAAARLVVDLSRRQRTRFEAQGCDELLLARIAQDDGPDLAFLKAEYRQAFRAAFARAFAALDDDQRTLLRLRFLDGLQLDEIARIAGVHRVTVSKTLARLRDRLTAALFDDLAETLRGEDPVAALALIRSRLSLSFDGLLAGEALAARRA